MEKAFSPQTEAFLAHAVASGMFPSKEAALEAAVEALREKTESLSLVPDEHLVSVEEAIDEARAGLGTPLTDADWSELRQRAYDAARNSDRHGHKISP